MPKIGMQKQVTVEEVEYTLQHPGTRAYAQIQDRIQMENGSPSNEKLSEEVFKHVIVQPKVDFDYFDEHEGYEELMKEAFTFLRTGK